MRFRLALLLSLNLGATSAFGEASLGGNANPYKTAPPAPVVSKPVIQAVQPAQSAPVPPMPKPAPVAPAAPAAPAAPPAPPAPSNSAPASDAELITKVDKTTQTILITSPDILNPHLSKKLQDCSKNEPGACMTEFFKYCKRTDLQGRALPPDTCMARVSTGGGVHTTNPKVGDPVVECTDNTTPTFKDRTIVAIHDPKNDPNNQDGKATVFPNYVSGAYQAPMKWAVRLQNGCNVGKADCGIFFHKYPPLERIRRDKNQQPLYGKDGKPLKYDVNRMLLGKNVSGGCVRMEESVAWFINQDILERGKMKASLEGVSPARCSPEDMATAQANLDNGVSRPSNPGGEGLTGQRDLVKEFFTNLFGGGFNQQPQPRTQSNFQQRQQTTQGLR